MSFLHPSSHRHSRPPIDHPPPRTSRIRGRVTHTDRRTDGQAHARRQAGTHTHPGKQQGNHTQSFSATRRPLWSTLPYSSGRSPWQRVLASCPPPRPSQAHLHNMCPPRPPLRLLLIWLDHLSISSAYPSCISSLSTRSPQCRAPFCHSSPMCSTTTSPSSRVSQPSLLAMQVARPSTPGTS
jgi:hypothetical protein